MDCYQATGEVQYLDRARRPLDGLRLFAVERPGGVAFPGDGLSRISCDYGTGAAGVALFMWRFARGGEPAFMLDGLLATRPIADLENVPEQVAATT